MMSASARFTVPVFSSTNSRNSISVFGTSMWLNSITFPFGFATFSAGFITL